MLNVMAQLSNCHLTFCKQHLTGSGLVYLLELLASIKVQKSLSTLKHALCSRHAFNFPSILATGLLKIHETQTRLWHQFVTSPAGFKSAGLSIWRDHLNVALLKTLTQRAADIIGTEEEWRPAMTRKNKSAPILKIEPITRSRIASVDTLLQKLATRVFKKVISSPPTNTEKKKKKKSSALDLKRAVASVDLSFSFTVSEEDDKNVICKTSFTWSSGKREKVWTQIILLELWNIIIIIIIKKRK